MWFLIGLITSAILFTLAFWLHSKRISVRWYEWLIGATGLLLLLFTIQNFSASFAEYEPQAAWTFLWVFGLPAFFLLTLACFLPWRRHRRVSS